MRIMRLQAENFRRLGVVDITPDGNVIEIKGANGEGKTSTLGAIASLLGGKALCPSQPIRRGETHGQASIDLCESLDDPRPCLTITRTWSPNGTRIVVKNAEGTPQTSPQKILEALTDRKAFDPLEFTRMKRAEQLDALLDLLGVRAELEKLKAEELEAYQERAAAKRSWTTAKDERDAIVVPAGTPDEPVSATDLSAKLEGVLGVIRENKATRDDFERLVKDHDEVKVMLAKKQSELSAIEEQLKVAGEQVVSFRSRVAALADPDAQPIRDQIEAADKTNADVANKKRWKDADGRVNRYRNVSDRQDEVVTERRRQRMAVLKAAEFPVDGLGIGDDGVYLNDLPFDQASSTEQICTSAAIGMARNPDLRIMYVKDGEKLDAENRRLLYETIDDADYQLWIERVSENDASGIVLVDGSVTYPAAAGKGITDAS